MVRFWNTGKYVFILILSFVLLFECGKKEIVLVTVVMSYLIVEPSHTYDVGTRPQLVCDTFLSCKCTLRRTCSMAQSSMAARVYSHAVSAATHALMLLASAGDTRRSRFPLLTILLLF